MKKKEFICCNNQKYSAKIYGCCNNQVYKLETGQKCCHFKNFRQVLYNPQSPKNEGCCESANKIFNNNESYCCGNNIVMNFNKNNKFCGPKNSNGKLYMDLVNKCCIGPEMDVTHYLWDYYSNKRIQLFGSDKYQLYREYTEGCCEGILFNKVEEQCIEGVVSKKPDPEGEEENQSSRSGPPKWLVEAG